MSSRASAKHLGGIRVLLTRPAESAAAWRAALTQAGATVVDYPTIVVGPPPSWAPLDAALAEVASFDWLVFTSASAARFVVARWPPNVARATLARPQVAAVGSETEKVLRELGFVVARVPQNHSDQRQEGLLGAFADLRPGTRVLFPRAKEGRDFLAQALESRGITVDVVTAYETRPVAALAPPPPFDVATFASPSALKAFVGSQGMGQLTDRLCIAIGATTAEAAAALGLDVVVARAPRVEAVIEAIVHHQAASRLPP